MLSEQNRNCRGKTGRVPKLRASGSMVYTPHDEKVRHDVELPPHEEPLLVWDIVPLEDKAQNVENAQQGEHPQKVE